MTGERRLTSGNRESGDPSKSGWLALKRFPGQKIFIFTPIGRLSVTLRSLGLGMNQEPQLEIELLDQQENPNEGSVQLKLVELSQKIAITARVNEDNPNQARIGIRAPQEYKILRGELYEEIINKTEKPDQ